MIYDIIIIIVVVVIIIIVVVVVVVVILRFVWFFASDMGTHVPWVEPLRHLLKAVHHPKSFACEIQR